MSNWFKRNGIHLAVASIFVVICVIYFAPAFKGKTLGQSDVTGAQSTQKEVMDYREKGTTILWTNQIFGGMPAYQIWAPYAANITTHVVNIINTIFPNPVGTVLIFLFGTYLLFCVLRLNPWLAAAGAIAFTFSSYNIILLVAGHANQAFAIAFFAPILAGMLLTFRGKYLQGAALTAFFLAMEVKANHIQMTYYLLLAIAILIGIELYHAIKAKATAPFFKSLIYLGIAGVLALGVNASVVWSTFEYSKDSYRGKSNLTSNTKEPASGLDKTYAYQYSQGVGECITFLVPNAYGGGSGTETLDAKSETAKIFLNNGQPEDQAIAYAQQITGGIPGLQLYWGEKRPSTAGPYYFGAGICFLFVFGLLVVRSRLKWWLLATVVLTMLLSFGGNWPYLSDFFFANFPLYNKFRAVESILAVTGLCFPILAFLSVQEVIAATDKKAILKKLMLALYITGGLTLLLILLPDVLLSFKSSDHMAGVSYLSQAFKGDMAIATSVANAIVKDRMALERADAIRSLIFVVLTFGIVWAFIKQKFTLQITSLALLALTLMDMWQVDKRYLKEANFTDKQQAVVSPREVDVEIAKDTDLNFRVFDATSSIKMDIINPFFHKSIGGYSAARLKRFDELIDNQLSASVNQQVLNMLNAKYIITPDSAQQALELHPNPAACGNAWFVKSIKYVDDANQEMAALSNFVPKSDAIVDKQYAAGIKQPAVADSAASIKLTGYNPDHMVYESKSAASQVAVFSEIYYDKGWKMLIDGTEQPYFRANYLLRAAQLPAGTHKVEFIFHPNSYYTGETISMASSVLLVLLLLGAIFSGTIKKQTQTKNAA